MRRQHASRGLITGLLAVLLVSWGSGSMAAEATTSVASGDRPTVIKGIDVVGVSASQVAELLRLLGLKEGMQVPYGQLKEAIVTPAQLKLEGLGRFRQVSVRPTTFIGGAEDGATYLTINLVDRQSQLASKPIPGESRALPPAIDRFFTERVRGLGAFRDTLLPSDQDRIEALAEDHATALASALTDAAHPEIRARAAQAIAFHPDTRWARRLLESSLRDPDAGVRRDVARALLPLVDRQVGREAIALSPYLGLLRFPEPADRMNAAILLMRLSRVPAYRETILPEAGAPLLAMAKMKHPGERTLALEALQVLSQAPAPKSWNEYRKWWEEATKKRFVE